jgi:hypothetical protein
VERNRKTNRMAVLFVIRTSHFNLGFVGATLALKMETT